MIAHILDTASTVSPQVFWWVNLHKDYLKPIWMLLDFRSGNDIPSFKCIVAGLKHAKEFFDHALFFTL